MPPQFRRNRRAGTPVERVVVWLVALAITAGVVRLVL